MRKRSPTAWADFLADQLSRYKHPESFEIVSVGPRDDSGKVRRTLLRDERAAWLKEGRAFRIMPGPAAGKAECAARDQPARRSLRESRLLRIACGPCFGDTATRPFAA